MRTFGREQTRLLRLEAQGLGARRWRAAAEVARGCGAVQAQDRMGELLAVRARSEGLTAADLERAQSQERSVARTWLHRGTLHLAPAEDLRWLLALLGEAMDRKALKRRADLGIDAATYKGAMAAMRRALSGGAALSRAELVERVRAAGLPHEGQVVPHLLRSASLTGLVCFGPTVEGADTHVLVEEWLAGVEDAQPANPSAELARRYFAAYGPAAQADFRWWSGLPAKKARAGFAAIADELEEIKADGKQMWLTPNRPAPQPTAPQVRVLGAFDPYLLGYSKRELGVSDELLRRVHPGGGMILPTVLVDGVMVATWTRRRTARGMRITIAPFAPLSGEVEAGISAEVGDIARFLGEAVAWEVDAG